MESPVVLDHAFEIEVAVRRAYPSNFKVHPVKV
jgi:hypothetical protein